MIPVCSPDTTEVEKRWVNKALDENRISSTAGFTEEFEEKFAEKIGVKYAISCNSGGSALFLALWALGIRQGDEVIVPTFTMFATANAVIQCGAKPVFMDSEYETGNINAWNIKEKITERTKAIIPVHIYGHPCDMKTLRTIARVNKLFIVEDAAEAHGAIHKTITYAGWENGINTTVDEFTGSMGDIGCFSFYANKIITTGEGGMVTTNNEELAKEIRALRQYDMVHNTHFWHTKMSWNLRLSSLQAAYGLGQLERWDELIQKRRNNATFYTEKLKGVVTTPTEMPYAKSVYWMYFIKTPWRNELEEYLKNNGIETRRSFTPLHWMPPFKEDTKYPIADRLEQEGLYLPSGSNLSEKDRNFVIKKVLDFFSEK